MIISASRRTDIPAFYSDWFFNRLQDGYLWVRNPRNIRQVSQIELTPDVVDCFVFWTKNPRTMAKDHARDLQKMQIPFYFQFTVNPYDKTIEPFVPEKRILLDTFMTLANLIGKERMIWRYDPIIFTSSFDAAYHVKSFENIAQKLAPYTNKCIISFLDFYEKTERNMRTIPLFHHSFEQKLELSQKLYAIAANLGLKLVTCAETLDFLNIGIRHGKCIDPGLIAHLCGGKVLAKKDKNQREECGCIESIDIGAYNTCGHGCLYCYANTDRAIVEKQVLRHNPLSPLLFGELTENDKITTRKMKSIIDKQQDLL